MATWSNLLKTEFPGIWWPRFPGPQGNALLATLYQFEHNHRMPADWIRNQQLHQAERLLRHASLTVPFYQSRLPARDSATPLTYAEWCQIPLLTRRELQAAGKALISRQIPPKHKELKPISTSGSTGMPVTCWTTPVTRFMFLAHLLQEHLWHRRDFQGKHLAIRPDGKVTPGKLLQGSDWGTGIVETGPSLMLNARTDIRRQAMFLAREQPAYLLSLPSNLQALAEYCHRQSLVIPSLKGLRSYGEVLTGETRSFCEKTWGVGMTDVYSSQEVGSIACECPEQKVKHSLPESLLLEVVKDDGTICQTGETGQVVLTTLLNYGAPLIRYALGDYAEVGAPCSCGRTTPVLGRIQGRSRNMLLLPNGDRIWPSFAVREWAADLPLTQFQFVQTARENLEARLVSERSLTAAEKSKLVKALHQRLTYPFRIDIRYLDELPRSNSGKYEDFICEIH